MKAVWTGESDFGITNGAFHPKLKGSYPKGIPVEVSDPEEVQGLQMAAEMGYAYAISEDQESTHTKPKPKKRKAKNDGF